jgi:hypothetical protein
METYLMSSIILYHTTTDLPKHLFDCIKQIRNYSNITIHLLTDKNYELNINNLIIKNINDFSSLKWINNLDYFNSDYSFGHLWKSSCYRLFYIQNYIEDNNLSNILHFDNDVLLFESPEKILEMVSVYKNKIAITAHNECEVVMGMSYIKDSYSMEALLEFVKSELHKGFDYLHKLYNGYPTEMQLISKSNQYETLPILPRQISSERYSNNFDKFNSIFDPSSYGQYLGGTYGEKKPGWYGTHHEIGKNISENKIKIFMEDKNPYLICQDQKIKINNLHIHSKQTGMFL